MHRPHRKTFIVLIASIAFGIAVPAVAGTDVGGQITVTTDYMFRGVSQTMSGAAVHGEVAFENDDGWYGYVWASNVDFTESGSPDDGANLELNVAAGYAYAINDDLAVSFGATAYFFPDTEPGFDYDYLEWHGVLSVDNRHDLTVGYSDNVFGSGTTGIFYSARTGIDLSEKLRLGTEVGHYELDDGYGVSYSYGQVHVAGTLKSVGWQLSYFSTTDEAEVISYESTISDRLVLALTVSF